MKPITRNAYIQSVNKASQYIAGHLGETIDVKTLASVANLSSFHFCRIFKAIKGEPPITFITRLRVETAAQLLRNSQLTVEEIAYNIGYETPASLSKAFRNQYGITPTQYRTDKSIFIMRRETINEHLALKEPKPQDEVSCKTLAGGKYAMFAYQGPYENLAAVYDEAMRWLVNSEHELRDEPIFAKYLNDPRRTPAEKLKTEVYLPLR